MDKKIEVCFVCLGNICRSPLAQGVFADLVEKSGLGGKIHIASAGTSGWHAGNPPDSRMRATAAANGIALRSLAQQFTARDFERFDLVFAMDRNNKRVLEGLRDAAAADGKLLLFRPFDPEANGEEDVPDPYYGGEDGFTEVFRMVHRAAPRILDFIRKRFDLAP